MHSAIHIVLVLIVASLSQRAWSIEDDPVKMRRTYRLCLHELVTDTFRPPLAETLWNRLETAQPAELVELDLLYVLPGADSSSDKGPVFSATQRFEHRTFGWNQLNWKQTWQKAPMALYRVSGKAIELAKFFTLCAHPLHAALAISAERATALRGQYLNLIAQMYSPALFSEPFKRFSIHVVEPQRSGAIELRNRVLTWSRREFVEPLVQVHACKPGDTEIFVTTFPSVLNDLQKALRDENEPTHPTKRPA